MDRSEQINELVTALAKAQGDFAPVERNGYNSHFGSSYSTLDDIIAAVKGPLSKNGLAYMQFFGQGENGPTLTTMLTHESGQFMSTTAHLVVSGRGSNELHRLGSTLTYMRRYMLAPLLGVNSETDDDGDKGGDGGNGKGKSPPPQTEKQQAAQEEKRRTEIGRQTVKAAWIAEAKELGLLSATPTSDEWASLIELMGETYKDVSTVKQNFDVLQDAGIQLLQARALRLKSESENVEEIEHAANLDAPVDVPPEAR